MKRNLGLLVAALLLSGCGSEPSKSWSTGPEFVNRPQAKSPPEIIRDLFNSEFERQGDRIFFGYDKSSLTPEARAQLDKWISFLNKYPNDHLTIEGHSDERGTREYNLALGERRANVAKSYLISQGIAASRLKTVSYGKERPAVLGSGETAWEQNRRAVGVIQ